MDLLRQADIFEPNGNTYAIIGAGTVGSYVSLCLAKMGIKFMTIFDRDKVEPHNVPLQFYRIKDIGQYKVKALQDIIRDFCNIEIRAVSRMVKRATMERLAVDTVIFGVDSMKARKTLFEGLKLNPFAKSLIDIRTAGEQYRIYTVDLGSLEQKKKYEDSLYSDKKASRLPCSAQGISYVSLNVASEVGNIIKKLEKGENKRFILIKDLFTGGKVEK